jgi:protoheme IX farnesyltransferase
MAYKETLRKYYRITKPGIIYGNLITATAGYLFASAWHNNYLTLLSLLIGLSLVIGCACVLNNIQDQEIDSKMARTKKRALVQKTISVKSARNYAVVLGVIGSIIIVTETNFLTLIVGLFGLLSYVVFYGMAKRRTIYSTLVGSLPGAIPPLAGYVAVTNNIDFGGILLVLILICWQLAHFYAISLYRKEEYTAAKLPVWSVVKGNASTQQQILIFVFLYSVFAASMFIFGYCGYLYLIIVGLTGIGWYLQARKSLDTLSPKDWGKKVFRSSLIVILITSIALSIGPVTF